MGYAPQHKVFLFSRLRYSIFYQSMLRRHISSKYPPSIPRYDMIQLSIYIIFHNRNNIKIANVINRHGINLFRVFLGQRMSRRNVSSYLFGKQCMDTYKPHIDCRVILTWQSMHLCTQMLKAGAISLTRKLLFCLLMLCPKPLPTPLLVADFFCSCAPFRRFLLL